MSHNKWIQEIQIAQTVIKNSWDLINKTGEHVKVKRKKDGSPVTNIDLEISERVRRELKKNFPEYKIIDEEKREDEKDNKFCWIVDPLDGTSDFIKGGIHFGTMIGLMDNYKPVAGIVYQPLKNRMVYGSRNDGAHIVSTNHKNKISVSKSEHINLLVSRSRMNDSLYELIENIDTETITMMPTSFKMLEVALGNYNAFINLPENEFNIWDACAHQVIVEESGGRVTDFYGKPIDYSRSFNLKYGLVVTNNLIHDKVIDVTSEYQRRGRR